MFLSEMESRKQIRTSVLDSWCLWRGFLLQLFEKDGLSHKCVCVYVHRYVVAAEFNTSGHPQQFACTSFRLNG